MSPHSRDVLYFGANRLYRSFDRGDTWTAISEDLTANAEQGDVPFGTITSVAESPKRFGVLYAGTDEGKVWGSRDGGLTWTDLSAGLAAVALGHARDRLRPRRGHRLRLAERIPQRRLRAVRLSLHRLRTHVGIAGRGPARGAGQHGARGPEGRASSLCRRPTAASSSPSTRARRGPPWRAASPTSPSTTSRSTRARATSWSRPTAAASTSRRRRRCASSPPEVRAKALHAFPIKTVKSGADRGYGDHPWITWPREDVVARIAYWSKDGAPATIAIKDEHGSLWRELPGASLAGDERGRVRPVRRPEARRRRGGHRAGQGAAEAGRREVRREARRRRRTRRGGGRRGGRGARPSRPRRAPASPCSTRSSSGCCRTRCAARGGGSCPPGRYTVEVRSAGATAKSRLTIKAPKDDAADGGRPKGP